MALNLLQLVDSQFTKNGKKVDFQCSEEVYSLALANKIPLTYLNILPLEARTSLPEYNYHAARLEFMLQLMAKTCKLLNEAGIDYVVFKTLRPLMDDVADIDVLCLGPDENYQKMADLLKNNAYTFMEKGVYCTTFQDTKKRFKTEAMIDVYSEISVSRLIYLDKKGLADYVTEKRLADGSQVKVFTPEAELLAVLAHAAIKENQYTLAEYYTSLSYLSEMDEASLNRFVSLIEENDLVTAVRWSLTITAQLYKAAHGKTPEALVAALNALGGQWKISSLSDSPPYPIDSLTLGQILMEKMGEPVFRRSFLNQVSQPLNRISTLRLLQRIGIIQK